jgi:PAS domain S-box-containing protein
MDETKQDRITGPPLLRVLILENNPRDAKLTASVLESGGVKVQFEVTDSLEVFRQSLEKSVYDVILADFNLHNWTSLDALDALQGSGKDIPLIVTTGTLGDEPAVECIKRGAADVVLKNRLARLPTAVQRALNERRLRAENLRASEAIARLATIIESSDDAIIGKTLEGVITSWNQGAEKLYGYSATEVLGKPISILAPPDRSEEVVQILARLKQGGRIEDYESVRVRKDGTLVDISLSIFPLFDSRGTMTGAASIARDISKVKRVEEALRRSEARFKLIEENIDEVFWISDPDISEITYISPAYERIWGRTRRSLLENPKSFIEGIHPEDRERVLSDLNLQKAGKPFDHEYRVIHTEASTRWIWDRGFPIRDYAGRVNQYAGVAQDITQRRDLERQVRQSQKMEAVGRLAGGIAHDFNNLLTIINGYSELALERIHPDDPIRSSIQEITKAGGRAASLTRQLLAFSRQQVMAPRVLDLNSLVADVEKMLRRLIGEDIELTLVRGPALGQMVADPGQIEQILMNLAVNARDAMPEGGNLTIETANAELDDAYVRTHPLVVPGRYVMLALSDTGIGMDPETHAHVFEPFFTTKEKYKGTGLGLATVYGIVKQSGGYIWVYSELGRGTTFRIYLPRVDEATESVQISEAPRLSEAGSETVLLVEDEEAVRALTASILQAQGYKVLESTSPEDALQIGEQQQEPIHLILTDVVLPRMSGRKIAEHLVLLRPTMKVLYMSGYTDDGVVRNGVLEADTAFLQKPFTPAGLARKVREVLDADREEMS